MAAPLTTVAAHLNLQAKASGAALLKDPAQSKHFVHFDCGTNQTHASDHLLETVQALHADNTFRSPGAKLRARGLGRRQVSKPIVIQTVFHIISTAANANSVTPDMPELQVAALNKVYNPVGFNFDLVNTTWTNNDAWAVGAGDDMNAMKKALRQGTYATLNIYFHSDLDGSILGKCSMPSKTGDPASAVPVNPSEYFDDGCSVNSGTMPNGSIYGYAEGMTAVHETGHWLGLFHIFEGYTCEGEGDFISDTPAQSESTDGCPVGPPAKNTCPDLPGEDAIHNIMDYSTDACYQGFSPLQIQRMQDMWSLYRAGQ